MSEIEHYETLHFRARGSMIPRCRGSATRITEIAGRLPPILATIQRYSVL